MTFLYVILFIIFILVVKNVFDLIEIEKEICRLENKEIEIQKEIIEIKKRQIENSIERIENEIFSSKICKIK